MGQGKGENNLFWSFPDLKANGQGFLKTTIGSWQKKGGDDKGLNQLTRLVFMAQITSCIIMAEKGWQLRCV